MDKRPTIKDVAQHAGVSKSTVSPVLQKSPLVKAETRRGVEASIKALGYVRSRECPVSALLTLQLSVRFAAIWSTDVVFLASSVLRA